MSFSISHGSRTLAATALVAGLALGAPASARGGEGEAGFPRRDVVWSSESNRTVLWLSLDLLLRDKAPPGSPLSDEELEAHRSSLLDRFPQTRCMPAELYPGPSAPPYRYTIVDVLTGNQLSVLGRVVETEVGWSLFLERVMTLVYLQIEEIFVDRHGLFAPGDVITFLDASGEIQLPRGRMCTAKAEGAYTPKSGDLIAFAGVPRNPANPNEIISSGTYSSFAVTEDPASGELILEPPPVPFHEQSPVTLDAVRAFVRDQG